MSTFVLVGGAWIGAWAWQAVAERLRHDNDHHRVYPLSLTGLAERVHLARPEIDLETHIIDVLNLLEFEDLTDVVLVGHSYAGAVVTGVADRAPGRLSALVYCDAGPLADGQSLLDFQPPEAQAATRRAVTEQGDGWRLPFPGFDALGAGASLTGLGDAARQRMRQKAVAHPFATYTQPLRLTRSGPAPYKEVVIACEDGKRFLPLVSGMLPRSRVLELDTGHWPMLSQPAQLARLLEGIG
jgi:pimeloyl-ACP methyl ester carboxylesterase